jgi:biotin carboxylase
VHEAYGIRVGAAHIELRMRAGKPVLIEVAARLAGDRITELVELTTGVDMCRETVRSFLGAAAPQRTLTYHSGACVRFVTAPCAGRFQLDATAVRRSPHLHSLDLPTEVDASGLLRDYRDRHGNLMVRAATAAEASRRADELLRMLTFSPAVPAGWAS